MAADDVMAYFRWRHSLEYAKPVKRVFLPFDESRKGRTDILYDSRQLCFGSLYANTLETLNLETRRRSRFNGNGMGPIASSWSYFLTNGYLVFMQSTRQE